MEYIDGVDLKEYIKDNPFDENGAIDLLEQIINALKDIHSQNIIHRDIKPPNIMRTNDGVYKLIDFTNNKLYTDKTITISGIISQGYTAIELMRKKGRIGAFSDIYSIGMTLYNVLSLDSPPTIADRFDDSYFQKNIDRLNISDSFKKTIRKMTAIKAEDRFQTLQEIEVNNLNWQNDIEVLKKFCEIEAIPKKFIFSKENNEVDKLKAFTLGCEIFKKFVGRKYNNDKLEEISKIKKVGVYQFLEATLQDEVSSIMSDSYYLKNLLDLDGKDIEEFNKNLFNGLTIDKYSTVGLIRDINQDSFRVSPHGDILIVADGRGENGKEASSIASDTILLTLKTKDYKYIAEYDLKQRIVTDLQNAIMKANDAVINYAETNNINMIYTTLSIALIYNQKLFVGHVGDSRIYRIRKNQDPISITQDHSLPEVLYRNGEITEKEKENYNKNILVYFIGKKDLKIENLNIFCDGELTDDTLLLCSDGVWNIEGIEEKFTSDAEELKRYILDSVPSDNATFVRCRFDYKKKKPVVDKIQKKIDNPHYNNNKEDENKKLLVWIGIFVIGIIYLLYVLLGDYFNTPTSPPITTPTPILEDNKSIISTPISTPIPKIIYKPIVDREKDLQRKPKIQRIQAKLDTSYQNSDLLTIGDTKIWFGKNYIKTNKRGCFRYIKNINKLRCKLKNINILNPEITKQLAKQHIGKIAIGNHPKNTWIVVTPDNSYQHKLTINERESGKYTEEIFFHKK